jgi:polynucleotide 5'-kinase involved in rRNA processing
LLFLILMIEVRILYANQLEFRVTEEASEMLSKIEGPVSVISVAGMYRTGKSYLLNRLLLN